MHAYDSPSPIAPLSTIALNCDHNKKKHTQKKKRNNKCMGVGVHHKSIDEQRFISI